MATAWRKYGFGSLAVSLLHTIVNHETIFVLVYTMSCAYYIIPALALQLLARFKFESQLQFDLQNNSTVIASPVHQLKIYVANRANTEFLMVVDSKID